MAFSVTSRTHPSRCRGCQGSPGTAVGVTIGHDLPSRIRSRQVLPDGLNCDLRRALKDLIIWHL